MIRHWLFKFRQVPWYLIREFFSSDGDISCQNGRWKRTRAWVDKLLSSLHQQSFEVLVLQGSSLDESTSVSFLLSCHTRMIEAVQLLRHASLRTLWRSPGPGGRSRKTHQTGGSVRKQNRDVQSTASASASASASFNQGSQHEAEVCVDRKHERSRALPLQNMRSGLLLTDLDKHCLAYKGPLSPTHICLSLSNTINLCTTLSTLKSSDSSITLLPLNRSNRKHGERSIPCERYGR